MRKELTDEELETYSRQIVLSDIGYDGQLKLRNARVCLVGVGGLGSPVALKLVGMGIGFLRVIDRDIVSRSDLHRKYLDDIDSIGIPKVEVLFQKLSRLNPDVTLDPVPESLNSINAEELLADMDVIIDGLDRGGNLDSRRRGSYGLGDGPIPEDLRPVLQDEGPVLGQAPEGPQGSVHPFKCLRSLE